MDRAIINNGLLVIDKPRGITSHDVVLVARKTLNIKKIGHIGTLDPIATGVLPLCIGEATKLFQFLTKQEKEYIVTIKFGEETNTLDSEGKVIFKGEEEPSDEKKAIEVIERFKGRMMQVPPVFSAIKKQGVPLYRLARKGIKVDVKPREVEIKDIEISNISLPYMTLRVLCSAGTYMRALCRDIGRELKWRGHLTALRRIRSGSFTLEQAITFETLQDQDNDRVSINKARIPISSLLGDIPSLEVGKDIEDKLRKGWQPYIRTFNLSGFKIGRKVRFLSKDGHLISIAEVMGLRREDKTDEGEIGFKQLRVFNV